MYSCGNFVYGVFLRDVSEEIECLQEDHIEGFLTYYSGSGDERPQAFGIELGGFDAIDNIDVDGFVPELKPEHKQKFIDLLALQAPEVQEEILENGEPKYFLMWSTS